MSADLFKPHHLEIEAGHTAGNGGAGRLFFLPGSDGRARRISEQLLDVEVLPSDRQLNVYLGKAEAEDGRRVDVGTVATGMGCPSLDIVVTELIKLGARHFIRVGTAGSLQPQTIRAGDLVVATAAVRDEGTSDCYVDRGFPAVAHPDVVAALCTAAGELGLAERTYAGVVHSKDSLFAREFGYGPMADENHAYVERLSRMGVLATEMECAHLFVLGHVHSQSVLPVSEPSTAEGSIRCGAVMAVIGDDRPFVEPGAVSGAEQAAVDLAVAAALELFA